MKKILIGLVVVAVVGGLVFLGLNNKSKDSGGTSATTANKNAGGCSTKEVAATSNQIIYNGSTFSPDKLTVKVGDKVTISNASTCELQFQSDPHPVHTDDPELNEGTVAPGSSGTFTVTEKGTHGYHNHLNAGQTGTLIVQ